jgi:hypothetical protein
MAKKRTTSAKRSPDEGHERYTIHLISGSTGDLLFRLASVAETHRPGAWPGGPNSQDLVSPGVFTYTGDGSGDIRIRIQAIASDKRFAGAIDNLHISPSLRPGDFDLDGDVDGFDFLKWQRGESPNPLSPSDLADWEANYDNVASLTASSVAVPEPTTGIMLLIGMVTMLTGGRTLVSKQLCVRHHKHTPFDIALMGGWLQWCAFAW